jgi:outer membrane protein OmpA-like peptidoglycan-associated protein
LHLLLAGAIYLNRGVEAFAPERIHALATATPRLRDRDSDVPDKKMEIRTCRKVASSKPLLAIAWAVALASAVIVNLGCATKKYVQQTVASIQKKVEDLDKKNVQQDASIDAVEKGVSSAGERAQAADTRAGAAAARSETEKGIARAGDVERGLGTLGAKVENLDRYKPATSRTIPLDLGKTGLTAEATQQLDAFASRVSGLKRFTIEVQGFTDSTGSPEANVRLSERRSDAVVRYLTLQRQGPAVPHHERRLRRGEPCWRQQDA